MADAETALATLVQNVKPGDMDSFLSTISKYEKLLDKGITIVEKLDRIGVLPAAIRMFGEKQGIKDIDRPLTNPLTLTATTSSHKLLFETLNKATEEQVIEMFKAASQAPKGPETAATDGGADENAEEQA